MRSRSNARSAAVVALALVLAACAGTTDREESRGVQYRTDHPRAVEDWAAHLELRPAVDGRRVRSIELVRVPVGEAAMNR